MNLRENLARRLHDASWDESSLKRNGGDIDAEWNNNNQELWLLVADECIRQMQWSRSEGMDGDREKPFEITLAPLDWKP